MTEKWMRMICLAPWCCGVMAEAGSQGGLPGSVGGDGAGAARRPGGPRGETVSDGSPLCFEEDFEVCIAHLHCPPDPSAGHPDHQAAGAAFV